MNTYILTYPVLEAFSADLQGLTSSAYSRELMGDIRRLRELEAILSALDLSEDTEGL